MTTQAPTQPNGAAGTAPLLIYAFVESYPHPYKPYYDAQFEDLVRSGHDVRIFAAAGSAGGVAPETRAAGLLPLVTWFPGNAIRRVVPYFARAVRYLLLHPARRIAVAQAVASKRYAGYRVVTETARMLTLPSSSPDLCIVHGLGPMSLLLWLRDLYPDARIALYYHGGRPKEAGEISVPSGEIFRAADIVFTNSQASRAHAVSIGCPEDVIAVIPVGIPTGDYARGNICYRPDEEMRLISVGRLSEGKGYGDALRAIATLVASGRRNLRYVIVGDGPERHDLEHLTDSLGIRENVEFRGTLSNADVIAALADSDALILPSYTTSSGSETQAVVLQEAMLMGVVVITTRTGGVQEAIAPDLHFLSVPERDVQGLAASIATVQDLAPDRFAALSTAARLWTMERYDISDTNRRLITTAMSARGARR